jgi:hypothetical protein
MMAWLHTHQEALGLLGLALIATMPATRPATIRELPGWLYDWARLWLQAFISFRAPRTPAAVDPPKPSGPADVLDAGKAFADALRAAQAEAKK